jgi:hypothetical protein
VVLLTGAAWALVAYSTPASAEDHCDWLSSAWTIFQSELADAGRELDRVAARSVDDLKDARACRAFRLVMNDGSYFIGGFVPETCFQSPKDAQDFKDKVKSVAVSIGVQVGLRCTDQEIHGPIESKVSNCLFHGRCETAGVGTRPIDAGARFDYDYRSGSFVRKISVTIKDPHGLWNTLAGLQPPPGAHGGYGMLGDDVLLGKKPGYGLRQLGQTARKYLTFESLHVEQPPGWEKFGVQSGTFTKADEMNDATLGWAFFDVRPNVESDLKKLLASAP